MGKVFSIINQKGGVGKSSTAVNLVAGLARRGYKALALDLDSQLCMSSTLQAKVGGASMLGVLLGEVSAEDAIQHTKEADIIPASRGLARADTLLTSPRKEFLLRSALEGVKTKYDYIVVDTNPALGVLTINALIASDAVIIPLQADIYSLDGTSFLMESINPVREACKLPIPIEGLLLTMYEPRSILTKEVRALASKFADTIGSKVFNSTIRRSITVREAQANQQSLFSYAPSAKVTQDYDNFITELLKEGK